MDNAYKLATYNSFTTSAHWIWENGIENLLTLGKMLSSLWQFNSNWISLCAWTLMLSLPFRLLYPAFSTYHEGPGGFDFPLMIKWYIYPKHFKFICIIIQEQNELRLRAHFCVNHQIFLFKNTICCWNFRTKMITNYFLHKRRRSVADVAMSSVTDELLVELPSPAMIQANSRWLFGERKEHKVKMHKNIHF